MKFGFWTLLLMLGAQTAVAGPLSFEDWKQQREREAQISVDKVRQMEKQGSENKGATKLNSPDEAGLAADGNSRFRRMAPKAEGSVAQAERNLQIARELTVNDYFILYLRIQSDDAFREGVDKLSKAQLSEIVMGLKPRPDTKGPLGGELRQ